MAPYLSHQVTCAARALQRHIPERDSGTGPITEFDNKSHSASSLGHESLVRG